MRKGKSVFKPDIKIVRNFAIIAVIFLVLVLAFNMRVIPCLVKPEGVPGGEVAFSLTMCSPDMGNGMEIRYSELSYFAAALIVLGIPYLIACWIGKNVKGKK